MAKDTQSTPNFYAIIPADVRYSSVLGSSEKLMYGEISALCNKEGFCWATNGYFSKLYGKDSTTISRWIKNLVDAGFISYTLGLGNSRKIYLTPLGKNAMRSLQKDGEGHGKNGVNNSIGITKTNKVAGTSPASSPSKEKEDSPIIDFKEELERLQTSPRRDLQVVGLFMEFRKARLQKTIMKKAQLSLFIKRHLRAAGMIVKAEYTDDQIIEFFETVNKKNKDIDWTIETVIKEITK